MNTTDFWAGDFGRDYTQRNRVQWQDRVPFWQRICEQTRAESFLDVGCNAGWNLLALRSINPDFLMSGVDLNAQAVKEASEQGLDVHQAKATDAPGLFGHGVAGLTITSGVLIHVPPEDLQATMQAVIDVSAQYVIAIEYEADSEQEVEYRGHQGKLWRRPFGKLYEAMGLSLVEYIPQAQGFDRCAAWLMEKTA
jgi:pseudaminic acid biosynthesis-associated methylase